MDQSGAGTEKAVAALRLEKLKLGSAMLYDRALKPGAVRVGLYLLDLITLPHTAERFGRTGKIRIYPSHRKIGEMVHISKDSVVRAIKVLAKCRYLRVLERGSNESGPNKYRIYTMKQREAAESAGGQKSAGGGGKSKGGVERKKPIGVPRK